MSNIIGDDKALTKFTKMSELVDILGVDNLKLHLNLISGTHLHSDFYVNTVRETIPERYAIGSCNDVKPFDFSRDMGTLYKMGIITHSIYGDERIKYYINIYDYRKGFIYRYTYDNPEKLALVTGEEYYECSMNFLDKLEIV